MKVYLVERMADADTDYPSKLRAVVIDHFPTAVLTGGAGYYPNNLTFLAKYKREVRRADAVVTSRRTLALGGTKEVEAALEAGIPVYTVHGRQLQTITHLWYVDEECVRQKNGKTCLGWEHRARMHPDFNRVAETRAAPTPEYVEKRPA